jgi:integrase
VSGVPLAEALRRGDRYRRAEDTTGAPHRSLVSARDRSAPRAPEAQLERRLLAGPEWQQADFLFTTGIGTTLDPSTLGKFFGNTPEKAKLPAVRFHDLRHSAATIALSQGVHPKIVSEMLGHSKISLTLDVYSHSLPTLQVEAADRIASALTGTSS